MPELYSIRHHSGARGTPWIASIKGLQHIKCPSCDRIISRPKGELHCSLEPSRGVFWPDMLGCGHYPILVVSERFLSEWQSANFEKLPCSPVYIDFVPGALQAVTRVDYFWIDGAEMVKAEVDLLASGYVNPTECPSCGIVDYDFDETFDNQQAPGFPFRFTKIPEGRNLFPTDVSECDFYCRKPVRDMIAKKKLKGIDVAQAASF